MIHFTMRIGLGTPTQHFHVAVESTSGGLWLTSGGGGTHCSDAATCNGPPGYTRIKYNPDASSSVSGGVWRSSWTRNGALIMGYIVSDKWEVADFNITSLNFVPAYSFTNASANESGADFFTRVPADGVIGIAWPSLNYNDGISSVMQTLMPQFDQPLFTVWLDGSAGDGGTLNGGMITMGAFDTNNCDATINYVPLSSTSYWQFGLDRISIGEYSASTVMQAMAAVDYSFIGGPQGNIVQMMRTIEASYDPMTQLYQVRCDRIGTLPDVRFGFGGKNYSVPANIYMRDVDLGDGNCTVGINEFTSTAFGVKWALGQSFMHVYCAVHDIGNEQIGFSKVMRTKKSRRGD